jgi:transport and Golgi organization protein 2
MCTVSLVPLADGVRMVCNRDEQRSRPAAHPPRVRLTGNRSALYPVDPASGGTWIGVNDAGLALALLNRNRAGDARVAGRSRGTLIPELLAVGTVAEIRRRLRRLLASDVSAVGPFTLVAVREDHLGVAIFCGLELRFEILRLDRPIVFTSSSLGDAVVTAPRRALFSALVRSAPRPLDGQRRFHWHRWPERPEISVCMSRPDAATVSRTIIDVLDTRVRLRYHALAPEP